MCHACRLTSLQNLTLACCKFTTVGISDLARLSGLTHLELMGCVDGISNGGLDTLRRVGTEDPAHTGSSHNVLSND